MPDGDHYTSGSGRGGQYEDVVCDRDKLAHALVEKLQNPVDRWWHARRWWRWELEEWDPSHEPRFLMNELFPTVHSVGHVLGHLLTKYEPGEDVPVVELLQWVNRFSTRAYEDGRHDAESGYSRASSAIRQASGLGYPDPDPIMGELLTDGGYETPDTYTTDRDREADGA